MLVGWYLRRGLPWMPLLGCCAGAVLLALALERWPSTALVLLPALLAVCAAGAAFCFDEVPLEVVAVTPRGGRWRRTARLASALIPLGLWMVLVATTDLPLEVDAWWLIGLAAIGLTVGLAALASRRAIATPGGSLSGGVVLAVIGPVVVCDFLDWGSLYPLGDFGDGLVIFWLATAGAGVLLCISATRPGLRA